jgi:hypothetical protein
MTIQKVTVNKSTEIYTNQPHLILFFFFLILLFQTWSHYAAQAGCVKSLVPKLMVLGTFKSLSEST